MAAEVARADFVSPSQATLRDFKDSRQTVRLEFTIRPRSALRTYLSRRTPFSCPHSVPAPLTLCMQSCLAPGQPGFGQLLLSSPKTRARRQPKNTEARAAAQAASAKAQNNSNVVTSSQAETKPVLTPPAGHPGPARKGSTGFYGTRLNSGGAYVGGLSTGATHQPYASAPTLNARYSPYGSFYSTPSVHPSSYPPNPSGSFPPYQPITRVTYPPIPSYTFFLPPQASAQAAVGLMSLNIGPQQTAYSSVHTDYGTLSDSSHPNAGFTFAPLHHSRPHSSHRHDHPPQLYQSNSFEASTSSQPMGMTRAYSQTPLDDGGAQDWQTYRTRQALTIAPFSTFTESSLRGSDGELPDDYRSSHLPRSQGEYEDQCYRPAPSDIYTPPSSYPPLESRQTYPLERKVSQPFQPDRFRFSQAPHEGVMGQATTAMSRSFFSALEAKTEFMYKTRSPLVVEKEAEGEGKE